MESKKYLKTKLTDQLIDWIEKRIFLMLSVNCTLQRENQMNSISERDGMGKRQDLVK